jgi:hypothetical protein
VPSSILLEKMVTAFVRGICHDCTVGYLVALFLFPFDIAVSHLSWTILPSLWLPQQT